MAHKSGDRKLHAEAAVLLGSRLKAVAANQMALACYETAIRLGSERPADLDSVALAAHLVPATGEREVVARDAEKGRRDLARSSVAETFPEIRSAEWAEQVVDLVPRAHK